MLSLNAALAHVSRDIDRRFDELLTVPDDPSAKLSLAMRHATIGCGKRLRALLVFATADLLDVDPECAGRVALAIECVHTYALIHHDDGLIYKVKRLDGTEKLSIFFSSSDRGIRAPRFTFRAV